MEKFNISTVSDANKKIIAEAQLGSLINTMYERCRKESSLKVLQVPLEEYEERVSYYTALPRSYIQQVLQQDSGKIEYKFDVYERIVILNVLYDYYVKQKCPKFRDIFDLVKGIVDCDDVTQLSYEMSNLGFSYRFTNQGPLIMEDPKYTFERYHYLKKIKKHRQNSDHICYIDELLIDNKFNIIESCSIDNCKIFTSHYVLYYVLSKKGLENYLISNVHSKDILKKWLNDIVLNILSQKCVVVLSNNLAHKEETVEAITRYHSKTDMMKWLRNNNIPFSREMHKAELYELVINFTVKNENNVIDNLLKAYGHQVLRVPDKSKNLSPTIFFWKAVTLDLNKKSVDINKNYRTTFKEVVDTVHKEKWVSYENTVINWEDGLIKVGNIIDCVCEKNYEFDKDNKCFNLLELLSVLENLL